MNNKRLYIAAFILVLFLPLLLPARVHGADLVTERYDVDIKVYEDYSWEVEETIHMNFLERHHGIFRYIPYAGKVYYKYEGREYQTPYRLKLKDVDIPGYKYERYNENRNLVLKIGDGNIYIQGPYTYYISYKAKAYKERTKGFEQFYWGLLPTEWNAPIETGTFIIEMPKPVKTENIEFIAGPYGAANTDWVEWSLSEDGKVIKGDLKQELQPYEGVTVRITLPEGYFEGAPKSDWMLIPMLILILLAPLLNFVLWRKFGVDPPVVRTVEFYPPQGLDPAQASYVIDSSADSKDIVGVIIYLANEGYLTIEEHGKKFKLIKTKEMPDSITDHRKIIFDGLFVTGDEVTEKEIKKYFQPSAMLALTKVGSYFKKNTKHRLFTKESFVARVIAVLISILPFTALNVFGISYAYGTWEEVILAEIFLPALFMIYLMHVYNFDRRNTMRRFKRFFSWSLAIFFTLLYYGIQYLFIREWEELIIWGAVAIIASLISMIFAVLMKKRTAYGAEMLGKILGFKEFLKVAEVSRIERLVEQDPQYFYATLPYAYVFGLTRVWAKKFEKITMTQPEWYHSSTGAAFSHAAFMKSISSYAGTIDRVSVPRSSGSGGGGSYSGGGGSSGGGMGGGGGGGW